MENLTELFAKHPNHKTLENILKSSKNVFVKGMQTSALSFFVSSDAQLRQRPTIIVMDNDEDAAYTYNDFQCAEKDRPVFFYPFSHKHSSIKNAETSVSPESLLSKTEVLDKISKLDNFALITYPEAIAENVICSEELEKNTLSLKVGDKVNTDFIVEVLDEYGFQRVDFVAEPGNFSQRGSIIDIYSYSNEEPYRIDFFGDEIDSIRTFDVVNQLSIEKVESITIIPDICKSESEFKKIPFLDFVNKNSVLWFNDLGYCREQIKHLQERNINSTDENGEPDPDKPQFVESEQFESSIKDKTIIDSGLAIDNISPDKTLKFNILSQPNGFGRLFFEVLSFHKRRYK